MFERQYEFTNEDGEKSGLIPVCIQTLNESQEIEFDCHYSKEFPEK